MSLNKKMDMHVHVYLIQLLKGVCFFCSGLMWRKCKYMQQCTKVGFFEIHQSHHSS